jgi:hypothetical protein
MRLICLAIHRISLAGRFDGIDFFARSMHPGSNALLTTERMGNNHINSIIAFFLMAMPFWIAKRDVKDLTEVFERNRCNH